jgi:hypothetical protein
LGKLKNDVAVFAVNGHCLQKSGREKEHLEFDSGSRRIEGTWVSLGPSIHGINCNLGGGHRWNRDMFLVVAVFHSMLKRCALADILGLHLTAEIVETATRYSKPKPRH